MCFFYLVKTEANASINISTIIGFFAGSDCWKFVLKHPECYLCRPLALPHSPNPRLETFLGTLYFGSSPIESLCHWHHFAPHHHSLLRQCNLIHKSFHCLRVNLINFVPNCLAKLSASSGSKVISVCYKWALMLI